MGPILYRSRQLWQILPPADQLVIAEAHQPSMKAWECFGPGWSVPAGDGPQGFHGVAHVFHDLEVIIGLNFHSISVQCGRYERIESYETVPAPVLSSLSTFKQIGKLLVFNSHIYGNRCFGICKELLVNRDQVSLFGCRSELGKRRCFFQNFSP